MIKIQKNKLLGLKKKFKGKNIAVIGDMMLDGYLWGDVKRISPEAPVPIVEIDSDFFRFGGAANVALNISKLGGNAIPFGVIGNDNDGKIFSDLIKDENITSDFIIKDNSRPTTNKTRVISADQHIVRIDKESKTPISSSIENKLFSSIESTINEIDSIILQDYNKGVLTPNLIRKTIALANKYDKIITVDPKFDNFFEYKNATLFKPNRKETENAFGIRINSGESIKNAASKLMQKLNVKYCILTLGEDGMAILEKGKQYLQIPTMARKALDVSGAGDTVIATITMALATGCSINEAAYLANYAGGMVCEIAGIVPIDLDDLFNNINSEFR
ncbi:ADP-heptose synthase / D-glycero-beta-D-manno-heptose 7-phosphate kinase [hydrothermal vent metagenome]|uniref:ADP-heptose synthase / D-glycero-beta-D-manno-heptose 7-phosphate kinase n=1 Tax=hydrothermal vent metagenome TaxID=652676 RepID=A0A3B1CLF2_9ZZZZ